MTHMLVDYRLRVDKNVLDSKKNYKSGEFLRARGSTTESPYAMNFECAYKDV